MFKKIFMFFCLSVMGVLALVGVINNITGFNLLGYVFDKDYRYYSFEHLHYDVEMLETGDSNIVMELSYNYKIGKFSRVTFDLEGEVSDISIYENDQPFTLLGKFDESRPENSYYYEKKGNKTHIELYMRAQKEKRKFTIAFKQKETTTLYNDCAVYFHKFLSQSNDMKIGAVSAKIYTIDGISKDNTLIWGHGAAHGDIKWSEDGDILLYIKNPPKYSYVEARAVMPVELFTVSHYKHDYDNKDNVIREETQAANKADKIRRTSALSTTGGITAFVIIILIPLFIRLKERKLNTRFVAEITPQYFRDIETETAPAVVNQLFYYYEKGNHFPKAVSSTIVDLIQRRVVTTEYGSKKGDITLRLSESKKEQNNWSHIDQAVINFLFDTIGNGSTIKLGQMRKFCKNKKNANKVSEKIKNIQFAVDRIFVKQGLEKHKKIEGKFSCVTVFMLLGAVGAYIFVVNNGKSPLAAGMTWILTGLVIGFVISLGISKKPARLSQKGENSLALWQGFSNFLNDFALFNEKELPELFMWERYLVYASALGMAKKILKQLKVKYPQLNDAEYIKSNNMHLFDNMYQYNSTDFVLMEDLTTAFEGAVADVQNIISNMSSSSSDGAGGGFSGGGSSGGSGSGGFSGGSSD